MQLGDIGRNAPCPCDSGRKFKKCCLHVQQQAVAGAAGELDVARLVEDVVDLDEDRRCWVLLAATSALSASWRVGKMFALIAPPRAPTADEHALYEALLQPPRSRALRRSILLEITEATSARGDHAGAALLRETVRMLQTLRR